MKKDKYTNFGIRIPKESKPWAMIIAWVIVMACSLYLIGLIAEQFEGRVEWP